MPSVRALIVCWRTSRSSLPGSPIQATSTPADCGTWTMIRCVADARSSSARICAYSASRPRTESGTGRLWSTSRMVGRPVAPGHVSGWRPPSSHLHLPLPVVTRGAHARQPPVWKGSMQMLRVRDLRVTYQRTILGLRDVSLDVADGAVLAGLGTHGARQT